MSEEEAYSKLQDLVASGIYSIDDIEDELDAL